MKPELIKLQEKLGKGKSTIGLQIGLSSVSAVQMVDYKGRATIVKTATENVVFLAESNESPDVLAALKTVLSKFSTRDATIICTVHHPQVLARKITVPPMPSGELRSAVGLAVRNFFPFSLDEAVWDFQVAGKYVYQGKERLNIVVAACPRKVIETIRGMFTGHADEKNKSKPLGIKVASCIPLSIALENLTGRIKSKADETLVIIELGAAASELNIYRNAHLELSRKLSVTGDDITRSMAGALYSDTGKTELSFQEAEEVKNEFGIPKPDEAQLIKGKLTAAQILSLIKPQIQLLVTEINQAIDYYRGESRGIKVDRMLLFGEEAQLKRLDEFLSDELGLEVKCGNPLEGVELLDPSLATGAEKLVSAVGAALGHVKGINLLSKESHGKMPWKIEKNILKTAALAATTAAFVMFLILNHQIAVSSESLRLNKAEFSSQLKKIRHGVAIRQLMKERPSWDGVLRLLSSTPSNIRLSELGMHDGQLHIKGAIAAEQEDPKSLLADFIAGLRKDVLKDARLISYKENQEVAGKAEFEVIASIRTVK